MVFSTSEVDTLNFNKFVKNFHGGTSKSSGIMNNLSTTSPWANIIGGNESAAPAAAVKKGPFTQKNLMLFALAAIAYYIFVVPKDKKKEYRAVLVSKARSAESSADRQLSSAPTVSVSVSTPQKNTTSSVPPSQQKRYRYRS